MVQITVQSYRRSLQEFSESPLMLRCKSLNSSHSLTGAPQSITEWLALWEKDPVEILLDLGFGTEEPDVCTKIPPRFLSGASAAKGINIRVFLEAQKERMDIERPNLYERFRQLEVLDHVTSALSSLLTDVNTQQTKSQDAGRDDMGLLDAAKSRPAVTRAKWRRIGQLLKRASKQTILLKQSSLAPGEANLSSKKEKPCYCADINEKGTVQVGFSAPVTLGCLTQEQTARDKGVLAYPTSQCSLSPLGKTWASLHQVAKQPHLSPACEVPAKKRPRKEPPFLVAHTLKKVADLNCKLPDSFEMEEIQSFEDETPCGNAPDITSEMMVTRTSSCQSDSSGFMEELPEPVVLQNASLSEKINFISDIHNQETALSYRTEFLMLNQDFQQKPNDCAAKVFTACKNIFTVPGSTEAGSHQREETHLLLTAGNGEYEACNAEPQSFVQELLCAMDRKEDKTGRKQLEKEECIKEHDLFFQSGTQEEGDPRSSKFDRHLYFRAGHRKLNVTLPELFDINPEVICESKVSSEDEGERCLTEKGRVAHCENALESHTECVKGLWWDVEVASKDDTLLVVNELANGQKFYETDGDSKSTRWFSKTGLPGAPQSGSRVQSESSATSGSTLQVSWRHPSGLVKGPGLDSSEDQETASVQEILDANKLEQGDTVHNNEMASAPPKSVTVQMSSGLEFTLRVECTGQKTPFSETLAREDPMNFSEGDSLTRSDPEALKDIVKQTTEASSQTDIRARIPRWTPLLQPSHTHLVKSSSLDNVFCGKYRSRYWDEASGNRGAQGSHCCHCCCCHGCCSGTFHMAVSPQCPVCCCSNHAATELQLLKTPVVLQDTAIHNLVPCTLYEIQAMKSSCQHFQEKMDEIEQHLTEQQVLFSSAMPDEGREEGRHLQLLRQAVRQEVAELEFWLNDQACQVREDILMQLDQLLVEQSHLFSELGLSDRKGERKAQNKQALTDATETVHPQSGCSKLVLRRSPSKSTTATGSLSALRSVPTPMQFTTRTTPEPNSAESDPQELSTRRKEINRPPQAKLDLKTFLHSVRKCFSLILKFVGRRHC
ncbi:protein ITPRID1 isoform X2 [Cuculus canorus]|uniref:protein ITPRID1 isoform X2 n=1 Tax=Cuculus canorus TaxID=55661 RepID=UPI0023AA848B|nr:protein ITPRID1 isoform X2 [Cuculus canorus]